MTKTKIFSLVQSLPLLMFAFLAAVAEAQTTTATVTPGVPNTGFVGNTTINIALLVIAAIVAVGGIVYIGSRLAADSGEY